MRVLFSMRHTGALRNFASTLQALAERNHQVHLLFGHQDKEGDQRLLDKLLTDFPTITAGEMPPRRVTPFGLPEVPEVKTRAGEPVVPPIAAPGGSSGLAAASSASVACQLGPAWSPKTSQCRLRGVLRCRQACSQTGTATGSATTSAASLASITPASSLA